MENMEKVFTPAVAAMQASAIREIFKLIDKKDIISFAAGIPSPELFPSKEWADITGDILRNAPTPGADLRRDGGLCAAARADKRARGEARGVLRQRRTDYDDRRAAGNRLSGEGALRGRGRRYY